MGININHSNILCANNLKEDRGEQNGVIETKRRNGESRIRAKQKMTSIAGMLIS